MKQEKKTRKAERTRRERRAKSTEERRVRDNLGEANTRYIYGIMIRHRNGISHSPPRIRHLQAFVHLPLPLFRWSVWQQLPSLGSLEPLLGRFSSNECVWKNFPLCQLVRFFVSPLGASSTQPSEYSSFSCSRTVPRRGELMILFSGAPFPRLSVIVGATVTLVLPLPGSLRTEA